MSLTSNLTVTFNHNYLRKTQLFEVYIAYIIIFLILYKIDINRLTLLTLVSFFFLFSRDISPGSSSLIPNREITYIFIYFTRSGAKVCYAVQQLFHAPPPSLHLSSTGSL